MYLTDSMRKMLMLDEGQSPEEAKAAATEETKKSAEASEDARRALADNAAAIRKIDAELATLRAQRDVALRQYDKASAHVYNTSRKYETRAHLQAQREQGDVKSTLGMIDANIKNLEAQKAFLVKRADLIERYKNDLKELSALQGELAASKSLTETQCLAVMRRIAAVKSRVGVEAQAIKKQEASVKTLIDDYSGLRSPAFREIRKSLQASWSALAGALGSAVREVAGTLTSRAGTEIR